MDALKGKDMNAGKRNLPVVQNSQFKNLGGGRLAAHILNTNQKCEKTFMRQANPNGLEVNY